MVTGGFARSSRVTACLPLHCRRRRAREGARPLMRARSPAGPSARTRIARPSALEDEDSPRRGRSLRLAEGGERLQQEPRAGHSAYMCGRFDRCRHAIGIEVERCFAQLKRRCAEELALRSAWSGKLFDGVLIRNIAAVGRVATLAGAWRLCAARERGRLQTNRHRGNCKKLRIEPVRASHGTEEGAAADRGRAASANARPAACESRSNEPQGRGEAVLGFQQACKKQGVDQGEAGHSIEPVRRGRHHPFNPQHEHGQLSAAPPSQARRALGPAARRLRRVWKTRAPTAPSPASSS